MRFVALETGDRRLAGRAMHTDVRDLPLPLGQVRLERLPAREGVPGDGVLFHIADAVLGLALRARPVRRTGPGREAPMPGERQQLVVELDRAAYRVVTRHERPRVVHQHLLRHAAEGRECALQP